METPDITYLQEWIANWSDIVDFEIYPVISSQEAAERVLPDRHGLDSATSDEK
jgi:hypothetical protein